jgi:hypothetical protein
VTAVVLELKIGFARERELSAKKPPTGPLLILIAMDLAIILAFIGTPCIAARAPVIRPSLTARLIPKFFLSGTGSDPTPAFGHADDDPSAIGTYAFNLHREVQISRSRAQPESGFLR